MILRTIAESVLRPLVFPRRLPREFGSRSVYVSPSAGLRYALRRMSSVDPHLLGLVKELVHEGNVVWDVGANVGLFSFAAAYCCGSEGLVVAFEPDSWLVQVLRRSGRLARPTDAQVIVVPVAVGHELGLGKFCVAKRSRSSNYLAGYGQSQTGGIAEEQIVPLYTVDFLAGRLRPPDILKIDVEGAEMDVLVGASEVIRMHRPTIICEVSQANSAAVAALLSQAGYALFDGEVPADARSALSVAPWTTIAIHSERDARRHALDSCT